MVRVASGNLVYNVPVSIEMKGTVAGLRFTAYSWLCISFAILFQFIQIEWRVDFWLMQHLPGKGDVIQTGFAIRICHSLSKQRP